MSATSDAGTVSGGAGLIAALQPLCGRLASPTGRGSGLDGGSGSATASAFVTTSMGGSSRPDRPIHLSLPHSTGVDGSTGLIGPPPACGDSANDWQEDRRRIAVGCYTRLRLSARTWTELPPAAGGR